ncbi:hypothetical protein J1605_015365 [Eschrichtius robustus]|uniref:Ras-related protein Rab-36 n=1 Tax=Eschrichtius robustus TaxID=9764 RepID=A0AB34GAR7_ESCRO|nr:hypothetical protein J1605_015365 [Eschrichtius robustus]
MVIAAQGAGGTLLAVSPIPDVPDSSDASLFRVVLVAMAGWQAWYPPPCPNTHCLQIGEMTPGILTFLTEKECWTCFQSYCNVRHQLWGSPQGSAQLPNSLPPVGATGLPGRMRSSVMPLGPTVSQDRVITSFPKWYTPAACLQLREHFHGQVSAACQHRNTGTVGLKLSKVVVVGDLYVGKTSLIHRCATGPGGSVTCRSGDHVAAGRGCKKSGRCRHRLVFPEGGLSLSGVKPPHAASDGFLGPHRFCKNVFNRDYKATIGVDFEMERFEVAGIPFSLQIWDTAGQEKFKCIASAYYRGAQVIITAFDLTDMQTLEHTRQVWGSAAPVGPLGPESCLEGSLNLGHELGP